MSARAPIGLILAAGEGRRMGGPKALLELDGLPLVLRHAARLHEVGCLEVAAVVRPGVAVQLEAHRRVRWIAAETGSQAESLAVGVRALQPAPEQAVFITPVDMLPPRPTTFALLLEALRHGAATPVLDGRDGHPVVVRGALLAPYLAGRQPTLRQVLERAGSMRVRVPVDDPNVLHDFDLPADLVRARGASA